MDTFKEEKESIFTDSLLGILNRRWLYKYLPDILTQVKENSLSLGFLMIDIDDFKYINDTYGHLSGDNALIQLTNVFKKCLSPQDKIVRYAGDEFIILVEAEKRDPQKIAERLISAVSKTTFKGENKEEIHCTISVGIAIYPKDASNSEELFSLADRALYFSKKKGKNRCYPISEVKLEEVSLKVAKECFPCKEFIGHQEDLLQAKEVVEIMLEKCHPVALFISGEVGVGKSRLLEEINSYLKTKMLVLSSKGSSEKLGIPYYLIVEAIRGHLSRLREETLRELISLLPPNEVQYLLGFLPEIASVLKTPVLKQKWDKEKRLFLFKGIRDLLLNISEKTPLVLSLDNLHYADLASLELLAYLLKSPISVPLFINGAFNPRYIKEQNNLPLAEFIEKFRQTKNLYEIQLGNLNKMEILKMINSIFPNIEIPEKFLEKIESCSQGNPFFIEESLKLLVEENFVFYKDNRWQMRDMEELNLPLSFSEIVKRRIQNLDPETKELLFEASLVGEHFNPQVLSRLGNKNEAYILELLEKAKNSFLVKEENFAEKEEFNFVNPFIREAIYKEAEKQRDIQSLYSKVVNQLHKNNKMTKLSSFNEDILQKVSQFFRSGEIDEYFKQVSLEIISEKEKGGIPSLDAKLKDKLGEFFRLMVAAVKNIRFFPPTNSVRLITIKNAFDMLKMILKKVGRLQFSFVEDRLMVNGEIFYKTKDIRTSTLNYFLSLMKDFGIKSWEVTQEVNEQEFNLFLEGLGGSAWEIVSEGGWERFIQEMVITNIKVREIKSGDIYRSEISPQRKNVEDAMLLEYILDKASDPKSLWTRLKSSPQEIAETLERLSKKEKEQEEKIKKVVESLRKMAKEISNLPEFSKQEYAQGLGKVIFSLKPDTRKAVFAEDKGLMQKVVSSIPQEEVLDSLEERFIETGGSILHLNEFIGMMFKERGHKKKEILPLLKKKLKSLGINDEFIPFVTGEISFNQLNVEEKMEILQQASEEEYHLLDKEKVKLTLKEIVALHNQEKLKLFLKNIFSKIDKESKGILLFSKALVEFTLSSFFEEEAQTEIPFFISVLLGMIIEEEEFILRNVFYLLGQLIKSISFKLGEDNVDIDLKRSYRFMRELMVYLQRRRDKEERGSFFYKEMNHWMEEFCNKRFVSNTLELLRKGIDTSVKEEIQKFILSIQATPTFGYLAEAVFEEDESQEKKGFEEFEEFVRKKRIYDILSKVKEPLIKKVKELISEGKIVVTHKLVDFLVYLKDKDTLELVLTPLPSYEKKKYKDVIEGLRKSKGKKIAF